MATVWTKGNPTPTVWTKPSPSPAPTGLLTWSQKYSEAVATDRTIRDGASFVGKAVFWRWDPTSGKTALLHSASGAAWTAVDVDTGRAEDPNTTGVRQMMKFDSKLAIVGVFANDNRLTVYETTDLAVFTKRHNQALNDGAVATDAQGAIAKVPSGALWAFCVAGTAGSPAEAFEDTGAAWTARAGLPNVATYSPEGAFTQVYVASGNVLRRWSGAAWDIVWTATTTINHMRYWSKQSRLILEQRPTTSQSTFYAYDGAVTPPPQIFSGNELAGTCCWMEAVGDDLYVVTMDGTGINGTRIRVYRCTNLTTATQVADITGFTNLTYFVDAPLVWHQESLSFYVAFFKFSGPATQYIYGAVSPASGETVWTKPALPTTAWTKG